MQISLIKVVPKKPKCSLASDWKTEPVQLLGYLDAAECVRCLVLDN